jgi:hypothetical protein
MGKKPCLATGAEFNKLMRYRVKRIKFILAYIMKIRTNFSNQNISLKIKNL